MSENMLLLLPSGVAFDILTCWLELKSVCKLDTAFCCNEQRVRFIELCQEETLVFTLTPEIEKEPVMWEYIQWVVSRRFHISHVDFPQCSQNDQLNGDLLRLSGKHFNSLSVSIGHLLADVKCCVNLRRLSLLSGSGWFDAESSPMARLLESSVRAVFEGCPLIEELDLGDFRWYNICSWFDGLICSNLSTLNVLNPCDELFSAISKSCPNITSLTCFEDEYSNALTMQTITAFANSTISLTSMKCFGLWSDPTTCQGGQVMLEFSKSFSSWK